MRREIEERIADTARRQYGVITRAQCLEAGLLPSAVRRRAAAGRLRTLHRGVYLVGPILPAYAREIAAVLACGPDALVSHRSAASLWVLITAAKNPLRVDVAAPSGHPRSSEGIRVHRVTRLDPSDRTTMAGIPVTTPLRTLIDFASVARPQELEQAIARAEREGLVRRDELAARIESSRGRPGIPLLRDILKSAGGPALTLSEAETRFLELVRRARLPAPEVNVMVEGYKIDFLWRGHRIAVEVDGFRQRFPPSLRARPPPCRPPSRPGYPGHSPDLAADRRRRRRDRRPARSDASQGRGALIRRFGLC